MPTGKQGAPTGLAKRFAEYVLSTMSARKWSYDYLAENMGMSRNYLYTRVNQQSVFTLRDFEDFARLVGLEPNELLIRVQFPPAAAYEGRLIPRYGAVGDADGVHIVRVQDADPVLQGNANVIEGRFGVGAPGEDEPSVKQPPAKQRTAARKGTRKADEAPHAE